MTTPNPKPEEQNSPAAPDSETRPTNPADEKRPTGFFNRVQRVLSEKEEIVVDMTPTSRTDSDEES